MVVQMLLKLQGVRLQDVIVLGRWGGRWRWRFVAQTRTERSVAGGAVIHSDLGERGEGA